MKIRRDLNGVVRASVKRREPVVMTPGSGLHASDLTAGLGKAVGNSGATTSMARSFKKRFAGPWWPLGWQCRRAATASDTRLPPLGIRSPADLL